MVQALLIALYAGISGIDLFNGLIHFHRPIVSGLVVGLILGDWETGLKAGAALELVYAGAVPLAGAQPQNVVLGGIVGTALAILSGQPAEVAVSLAVPFAVAAQAGITLLFTVYSPVMHKMDVYAKEANTKAIERLNYLGPVILFVFYSLITFIVMRLGEAQAKNIVEMIPEKIIDGLGIAGGILPAVGFGMLLKVMFKIEYAPFFAVGFIAVAYLGLPVMAVAIIGAAIAGYDYFVSDKTPAVAAVTTSGEEDYSDGI